VQSGYLSKLRVLILTATSLSVGSCGTDHASESLAPTSSAPALSSTSTTDPTTSTSPAPATVMASTSTAPPTSTAPRTSTAARPVILASKCTVASAPVPAPSQAGLTDAASTTRAKLIDAATRCDLSELGAIASSSTTPFRFSFGHDPGDPTEVWRNNQFDPAILLRLFALDMKHRVYRDSQSGAVLEEYFIWPGAAFEPTDHDWQAAEALYPASELARMKEMMGGYTGIRAFITPDGHWSALVEGD
jgi:hypothetical protein